MGFFEFVGLTRPRLQKSAWIVLLFIVAYVIYYKLDMSELMESVGVESNTYYNAGLTSVIPAFIGNVIGNGRGFIQKRLNNRIGTWPAIILQAILFGLMQNGLYLLAGLSVPLAFHVGIFLSTSIAGFLCGTLNEKVFDGKSIIPSVLLHGLNNFVSALGIFA